MARDRNAQLAVDEFIRLADKFGWDKAECWKGIVILLLSCDVWRDGYVRLGTLRKHKGVPDCVVFREANDFKLTSKGVPNATVRRGLALTDYLAVQLGVNPKDLCDSIGRFFKMPPIDDLQPNNVRGHAFRSIVCAALERYGSKKIAFEEEIDVHKEFPGYRLDTRSADAKLDIIARKDGIPVALISVRWALRHDRVDIVEEALSYGPAARRSNRNCSLYGVVGECAPDRLLKVLDHVPELARNPSVDACVHYHPDLIWKGLDVNGNTVHLKSLEWLIDESFKW